MWRTAQKEEEIRNTASLAMRPARCAAARGGQAPTSARCCARLTAWMLRCVKDNLAERSSGSSRCHSKRAWAGTPQLSLFHVMQRCCFRSIADNGPLPGKTLGRAAAIARESLAASRCQPAQSHVAGERVSLRRMDPAMPILARPRKPHAAASLERARAARASDWGSAPVGAGCAGGTRRIAAAAQISKASVV